MSRFGLALFVGDNRAPMRCRRPVYQRILLKLSGEALMGEQKFGIAPDVVARIADEIRDVHRLGVEIAVVVGGGNIIRGSLRGRAGHRPRRRRPHGAARDRHQRPRAAGRAREAGRDGRG